MMVVAVDMMGQGLVYPVFNTLLLDPAYGFVAEGAPAGTGAFSYGIALAIFYFFWFFGAAYLSKLSDQIGRKPGIVICLVGALAGYLCTVVAIWISSFPLLLLGRAIAGFTAGNQPIAQAAFVDLSRSDAERSRNMGLIMIAVSLGLLGGPVIAGVFSSEAVLGEVASLWLPFAVAAGLIVLTGLLVQVSYHPPQSKREKIRVSPVDVVTNLVQIREHSTVMKLSLVFFLYTLAYNAYAIFVSEYLTHWFDFSTWDNSVMLFVLGVAMGVGGFAAAPLIAWRGKVQLVLSCLSVMGVAQVGFLLNREEALSYVWIFALVAAFSIAYPAMLGLFSESVGLEAQGWVMGITVALFTLACSLISLAGGALVSFSAGGPMVVGLLACVLSMVLMGWFGTQDDVRALEASETSNLAGKETSGLG